MADGYATAAMAGLRAALLASPALSALVGDRIVDEPRDKIAFPYIRFGRVVPAPDDTDGAEGALVTIGLRVHSKPPKGDPNFGSVEAMRICEAIQAAVHRNPDLVAVTAFSVSEIEVQTWQVDRRPDGEGYLGRMSLQVHLDA